MYNHAPKNYNCPFCHFANGENTEYNSQDDIVYKDKFVTAFVSPKWWRNNPGHVIIIPNKHYEHIYDLPLDYATEIHRVVREIALAFKKVYKCKATSIRQHNEPDGNQDVFHYHTHVFPRYKDDNLYLNHKNYRFVTIEEKRPYVKKLKQYFAEK